MQRALSAARTLLDQSHNLRGPERVRGQGARACWVQAIVASHCVRALVLSGARRPPPARSQVADLGGAWQSFRRSVKRSRARSTRLHGPPPPAAVPAIWWVRVLARIPLAALYGVAHLVAWMAYRVVPYRKQLVRLVSPRPSPNSPRVSCGAVRHRYYLRFAQVAVELIKAPRSRRPRFAAGCAS